MHPASHTVSVVAETQRRVNGDGGRILAGNEVEETQQRVNGDAADEQAEAQTVAVIGEVFTMEGGSEVQASSEDQASCREVLSLAAPEGQSNVGSKGYHGDGTPMSPAGAVGRSVLAPDARECTVGGGSTGADSSFNFVPPGGSVVLDMLEAEDAICECEASCDAGQVPDLVPALDALFRFAKHAVVNAGAEAQFCLLAARLNALG